jgi:uncharacterized protein YrrD
MEFRFGADIRGRDGDSLGTFQRVICDTGTQQVVALVATEGGLAERQVVVPIGAVADSDDEAVTVELSRQQFAGLEDYVASARNIAPPPDIDNIDEDQVTDPIDIPDVAPIGAATGIESIAFTPIIEEVTNVDGMDQVLDSGTAVWATDGDLGQLRSVEVSDETKRISAIVFGGGGNVAGSIEVPAERIASVQTGTIILAVDRAAVESGVDA